MDAHRVDIAVVGAGIAGLAAALTCTAPTAPAGLRVAVLDAHLPGGRARTAERDGFLHNVGPHALFRRGHLAALLAAHGITPAGRAPEIGRVLLGRDGALTPLTLRPADLLRTRLLGRRDRVHLLRLLLELQRGDASRLTGRSVSEWLDGNPEPVRQFVEMFVRLNTYTDAPDELDAGAAVQQVRRALGAGVLYLDGGWGSLVDSMTTAATSRGVTVHTGTEVGSVTRDGDGVVVHTGAGAVVARAVVLAAGGPATVQRLTGVRPDGVDGLTAEVTASCLDLALARPHARFALGLDEPLYLNAHAPVAALAPDGHGLVSVLRYLAPGQHPAGQEQARAELAAFARLTGIDDSDVLHDRYLHRSVVCHGSPTARAGGLAGRPAVDSTHIPGVFVAGDWVGGAGMLADASAASGEAAASAAARHCATIAA